MRNAGIDVCMCVQVTHYLQSNLCPLAKLITLEQTIYIYTNTQTKLGIRIRIRRTQHLSHVK